VLISQDGRALLSDFGISRLLINSVEIAGTTTLKGTARWMAPELIAPEDIDSKHEFHTKATDVWAFGMTVYVCIICLLILFQLAHGIAGSTVGEVTVREEPQ
jgi:serine/threonine protein kinase